MKLEGKKINFLGDSITQGIGVEESCNFYVNRIAERYGAVCRNYGISGTRIARQIVPGQVTTRWDLYFELRAEIMDRNADAVVVFGGTNDYGHGDAPFGSLDSEDTYTFCGALNSLIKKLKKDFPGKRIIFMTPLHRLGENNPSMPDSKTLSDYVDAMVMICKMHQVDVIDLFKINPLDPADKELVPDGLHPSDKGHSVMAEVIAEELIKL